MSGTRCSTGGSGDRDDGEPWGIWNLRGWKEQFARIERDEKFDAKSQVVARITRQQMEGYEAEEAAEVGAQRPPRPSCR